MKNLVGLLTVAFIISASAQAIFSPTWERPIYKSKLNEITHVIPDTDTRPISLKIHQRDTKKEPTLISLVEDTGIRCVRGPCPSTKTTLFIVEKVEIQRGGGVRYIALQAPEMYRAEKIHTGVRKLVVSLDRLRKSLTASLTARSNVKRHFIGKLDIVVTPEFGG